MLLRGEAVRGLRRRVRVHGESIFADSAERRVYELFPPKGEFTNVFVGT